MGRCSRVSETLRSEPYYTREGFRGRYAIGDPARRARGRLIVTYFFLQSFIPLWFLSRLHDSSIGIYRRGRLK